MCLGVIDDNSEVLIAHNFIFMLGEEGTLLILALHSIWTKSLWSSLLLNECNGDCDFFINYKFINSVLIFTYHEEFDILKFLWIQFNIFSIKNNLIQYKMHLFPYRTLKSLCVVRGMTFGWYENCDKFMGTSQCLIIKKWELVFRKLWIEHGRIINHILRWDHGFLWDACVQFHTYKCLAVVIKKI